AGRPDPDRGRRDGEPDEGHHATLRIDDRDRALARNVEPTPEEDELAVWPRDRDRPVCCDQPIASPVEDRDASTRAVGCEDDRARRRGADSGRPEADAAANRRAARKLADSPASTGHDERPA